MYQQATTSPTIKPQLPILCCAQMLIRKLKKKFLQLNCRILTMIQHVEVYPFLRLLATFKLFCHSNLNSQQRLPRWPSNQLADFITFANNIWNTFICRYPCSICPTRICSNKHVRSTEIFFLHTISRCLCKVGHCHYRP